MSKKAVTIKEEISQARANLENLLRNITFVNDSSCVPTRLCYGHEVANFKGRTCATPIDYILSQSDDEDSRATANAASAHDGIDGSPKKKAPYNTKKRRKAAHEAAAAKQLQTSNTYVVRLFDRTIDVAHYDEGAPLYPLCRAWFRNSASEQCIEPTAKPPTQMGGEMQFPPPYMTSDEEELSKLRIPPPISRNEKPLDINAEPVDAEKLLLDHLSHWKSVRESWKTAGRRYESRFATSHSIIKQMYESAAK